MKSSLNKNLVISERLSRVLNQLEHVTQFNEDNNISTPAHGGEGGRNDKEFPRVLGQS